MKKMYLAIFLIILVVLVFAGCKCFTPTIDIAPEFESDTQPVTDNTYIPPVTDNNGGSSSVTPSNGTEGTTAANTGTETPSENQGQTIPNNAPTVSEYNILKSGNFYMKGSMVEASGVSSPMEVAVTSDSIYMLADFEGESMGMLVADDTVYMIYPGKKAYLELSDSLMSMAGLDIDDLVSTDTINFASYGDLSEADATSEEEFKGVTCQVYTFADSTGGTTKIYMNGTEIMRIASYDKNGKFTSSTDIDTISGTVPADKSAPPSAYKAYKGITGMMSFMTLLGDALQ